METNEIKDKKTQSRVKSILEMFKDFGVDLELAEVIDGYRSTRIHLKMVGKRHRMITFLQYYNDLSYALGMNKKRISIEAPVPDKPYLGIILLKEEKIDPYLWKNAIASKNFPDDEEGLIFPVGINDYKKEVFDDVFKLPHLLIGGSTGSGKSIFIHNILSSLVEKKSPEELKLLLVDLKHVELSLYNVLPHMLIPAIDNPKKAVRVFKWLTKEMERRYDILEDVKMRDITTYHKNIYLPEKKKGKEVEAMPHIVVVIDELADIMAEYPKEMEASIVRLAQMSRAVGIHLIIATQRPTVNIVTGLMKANIPARAAFQVASQVDSRTILDTKGAENLLGAGDMLYLAGDAARAIQLQAPFITEPEIKELVKKIAKKYPKQKTDNMEEIENAYTFSQEYEDDDLYEKAKELVIETKKATTSQLQRMLSIGYSRAARLIDTLEEREIIGPQKGSKPREVLIDEE